MKGCGKAGVSLQPMEISRRSREKREEEGEAERIWYGLAAAPHSSSPALLRGEESGSQE